MILAIRSSPKFAILSGHSRMVHFRSPRGDRQGKVGEIQYRISMLLYWLPPPEII